MALCASPLLPVLLQSSPFESAYLPHQSGGGQAGEGGREGGRGADDAGKSRQTVLRRGEEDLRLVKLGRAFDSEATQLNLSLARRPFAE